MKRPYNAERSPPAFWWWRSVQRTAQPRTGAEDTAPTSFWTLASDSTLVTKWLPLPRPPRATPPRVSARASNPSPCPRDRDPSSITSAVAAEPSSTPVIPPRRRRQDFQDQVRAVPRGRVRRRSQAGAFDLRNARTRRSARSPSILAHRADGTGRKISKNPPRLQKRVCAPVKNHVGID